jgi:hypothetical protein
MPALASFDYAVVRVVPRVERGEFVNAGVILFCRTRRFLHARVALDERRLRLLSPDTDSGEVWRHLEVIPLICAGGAQAGPIGQLDQAGRFHWLVAPRSTMIQTSPVHSGMGADPAATLDRLFHAMVEVPTPAHEMPARTIDAER